jgi:heme-degrading monooxygenase HmoA
MMASYLQAKEHRHNSRATAKKDTTMFAHVLDCQARIGRNEHLGSMLGTYIPRILQGQEGFVDFLVLTDTTDDERYVCVSFWVSRKAAEEYHHQHYEEIFNLLETALASPPALQGFTVKASTAHRIAFVNAA